MAQPEPYRWDYDRNAWDSAETLAETFSVGVYQWLPAVGGKGLKKSKSIRVNGYTAEPLRVYVKAQELCDQLNAEGIRADEPPAWLRKQYSVPRPAAQPAKAPAEGLTGEQVRALRTRVMKEKLLPHGFRKARGGTYVREAGEEIHLVDFQADRWGREYYVNLGFHYRFVPSYSVGRTLPAAEYGVTHCAVTARLREGPEGGAFPYGEDLQELVETLERNARDALATFARYSREWQDPAWWIETAPALRRDPWVDDWLVRWPELFAAAVVAVHLGKPEAADELLAPLRSGETPEQVRAMARSLRPETA